MTQPRNASNVGSRRITWFAVHIVYKMELIRWKWLKAAGVTDEEMTLSEVSSLGLNHIRKSFKSMLVSINCLMRLLMISFPDFLVSWFHTFTVFPLNCPSSTITHQVSVHILVKCAHVPDFSPVFEAQHGPVLVVAVAARWAGVYSGQRWSLIWSWRLCVAHSVYYSERETTSQAPTFVMVLGSSHLWMHEPIRGRVSLSEGNTPHL